MRTLRELHEAALVAATTRIVVREPDGTQISSGTGFFITNQWLLTCAHVIKPGPGRTVEVRCDDGAVLPATVLCRLTHTDEQSGVDWPDVALLEVPDGDRVTVPLGEELPAIDTDLWGYGVPLTNYVPAWEGIHLTVEGPRRVHATPRTYVKTRDGQVRPGASGAAVIDPATGLVVGLMTISRDIESDLGALLLPVTIAVDALEAEGFAIRERNQEAGKQTLNGFALAERRFRYALQAVRSALAGSQAVHLREMLDRLDPADRPLSPAPPLPNAHLDEAAVALLNRDIHEVGEALEYLARIEIGVPAPFAPRAFDQAAAVAWIAMKPWIPMEAASLLAKERDADRPRLIHFPVSYPRSVTFYCRRAEQRRPWRAVWIATVTARSVASDLPEDVRHAVRCELLREAGIRDFDSSEVEDVDRLWTLKGPRALREAGRLIFVLDESEVDRSSVEALQKAFPTCVFAVNARTLKPGLNGHARILRLAGLDEEDEREADEAFELWAGRIKEAVSI